MAETDAKMLWAYLFLGETVSGRRRVQKGLQTEKAQLGNNFVCHHQVLVLKKWMRLQHFFIFNYCLDFEHLEITAHLVLQQKFYNILAGSAPGCTRSAAASCLGLQIQIELCVKNCALHNWQWCKGV